MKKVMISTALLSVMNLSVFAADILIQEETHVGFAPPSVAGVYKFQLLTDGVVQRIDNKKVITHVAKLSQDLTDKVKTAIDAIQSGELNIPEGHPCTDVPSHYITVYQTGKVSLTIWKSENCRTFTPVDAKAIQVVNVFQELDSTFSRLHTLMD